LKISTAVAICRSLAAANPLGSGQGGDSSAGYLLQRFLAGIDGLLYLF